MKELNKAQTASHFSSHSLCHLINAQVLLAKVALDTEANATV